MSRAMFSAVVGGVLTFAVGLQTPRAVAAPAPDIVTATDSAADLVAANPGGAKAMTVVVNYDSAATRVFHGRLTAFARANPDIKILIRPVAGGGPLAEFLAKAAYTAARQDKFPAFHDAALTSPQAHTWYSLRDSAPLLGLDWSRFQQDYQKSEAAAAVQGNAKYVEDVKVTSVPAVIVAGRVFTGAPDKIDLDEAARAARGG